MLLQVGQAIWLLWLRSRCFLLKTTAGWCKKGVKCHAFYGIHSAKSLLENYLFCTCPPMASSIGCKDIIYAHLCCALELSSCQTQFLVWKQIFLFFICKEINKMGRCKFNWEPERGMTTVFLWFFSFESY